MTGVLRIFKGWRGARRRRCLLWSRVLASAWRTNECTDWLQLWWRSVEALQWRLPVEHGAWVEISSLLFWEVACLRLINWNIKVQEYKKNAQAIFVQIWYMQISNITGVCSAARSADYKEVWRVKSVIPIQMLTDLTQGLCIQMYAVLWYLHLPWLVQRVVFDTFVVFLL